MTKIRVLQIITRLVTRGASRHVIDLSRSLDPDRFDVEIAAGHGEAYEREIWDEAEATGLTCHRVEHLQREISPWADLRAYFELRRLIRRGNYDIVHTHISKSGLLGRLAARGVGVPVVVHTYHGIANEITGRGPRTAALRACERWCAPMADGKICISQRGVEQVAEAGIATPEQIRIIHNGIDLDRYQPENAGARPDQLPAGPVIGTVGSLSPEKKTSDLLEAAAILLSETPDLTFCIVGDGALRGDLERQAQDLRIADRVVFAGAVEDVRPWVGAFDLFVLTSRREGLPGALMEAMAMGRPVVATDVGGVSEVVGDAGVLVSVGDVEAIVKDVRRLLSDSAECDRLRLAGHEQVQQFSLTEMARATGDLYEELITSR